MDGPEVTFYSFLEFYQFLVPAPSKWPNCGVIQSIFLFYTFLWQLRTARCFSRLAGNDPIILCLKILNHAGCGLYRKKDLLPAVFH